MHYEEKEDLLNTVLHNKTASIAILGSNGILGSQIVKNLLENEFHIEEQNSYRVNEDNFYNFMKKQKKIKFLINCVALRDISKCEENPSEAFSINSQFPGELAYKANFYEIKIIHISTPSVFNTSDSNRSEKKVRIVPESIYGKTKLLGEENILKNSTNAKILRVNFFHLNQTKNNFYRTLINSLLNKKEFIAYEDIYFNPMYIRDLSKLILSISESELYGFIHVATNKCFSKYEFSLQVARLLGYVEHQIIGKKMEKEFTKEKRSLDTCLKVKKILDNKFPIPSLEETILNSFSDLETKN